MWRGAIICRVQQQQQRRSEVCSWLGNEMPRPSLPSPSNAPACVYPAMGDGDGDGDGGGDEGGWRR